MPNTDSFIVDDKDIYRGYTLKLHKLCVERLKEELGPEVPLEEEDVLELVQSYGYLINVLHIPCEEV